MVENTEWTVAQVCHDLEWSCPVKIFYDDKLMYNDYDDCEVSFNELKAQYAALLKDNSKVGSIIIDNVDFHHSIIHLYK